MNTKPHRTCAFIRGGHRGYTYRAPVSELTPTPPERTYTATVRAESPEAAREKFRAGEIEVVEATDED